jgi:hypothetical protein
MEKVRASFFPLVIAVSQSPEQSEGEAWQSLLAKFQMSKSK